MAIAEAADAGLDVRPLSGSLGAEVRGLRLAGAGADVAAAVTDLLMRHQVLFFPDQHLSPDEHIAFGRLFGRLEGHPNLATDPERPEFFELRATDGAGGIADEWHSDLTFQDEPSIYSILHMRTCPAVGGDTMWASMYRAYDALSRPMKELCEGLSAIHNAAPHDRAEKMAIHPVVRRHPVTGRKSLFVNEHFTRRIVELSRAESDVLLAHLTRHATQPRFTIRYRWQAGTIAMWDNRCTQHHVLDDFTGERVIQRVTVVGDRPEPAAAPRHPPHDGSRTATSWWDLPYRRFLRERAGA